MHRKEWVERLRGLGIRVKDVARDEGLNVEGMYHWGEVPRWAEWYLAYQEERQKNLGRGGDEEDR